MKKLSSAYILAQFGIILTSCLVAGTIMFLQPTMAAPTTQSGAVGIQGTIPSAPPSQGATIAIPSSGTTLTNNPITVSGLCPSGLLVKILDNGIFVGSSVCTNGSYTLQVGLFSGQNNLVAMVYDALDQPGPASNTVTVTFNDSQFLQFGTPLTLTTSYAEYGAPPGTQLNWPIQINGGTGPFAVSVDWGDGSPDELLSSTYDGTITLKHTYSSAGVYTVVIKAVDHNNEVAFLQLVGQATGAIQNNVKSGGNNIIIEKGGVLLWPALVMIPLIFVGFWIGRKYENKEIRRKYLSLDQ